MSELQAKIDELNRLETALIQLTADCLNANGGALYPLDLMAAAAAKRSFSLVRGFRQMLKDRNMLCAGALLRLQLDTALRFYAASLVDNPHEFAVEVLGGAEIRKLKDRSGTLMTDKHLVQTLMAESDENCWIGSVYRETSGFVHFSVKHMMSVYTLADGDSRKIQMKVSATDDWLNESVFLEAASAFVEALTLFMKYLHGWGITKENPHLVGRRESRGDPDETPV